MSQTQTDDRPWYPMVPTLHSGIGILTDFAEMAAYVLRHVISNPGRVNLTTEDELCSLRYLVYQHEQDPDTLCGVLQNELNRIYRNITLNNAYGEIEATCKYRWTNEANSEYDLEIELTGSTRDINNNATPFNITGLMEITKDKTLNIKFRGIKNV